MKLSEFAREHVVFDTPDGPRPFSEQQIQEIIFIEEMAERGYEMVIVKGRGRSKIGFVKNDKA